MNFEMYNLVDLLSTANGRASRRHWWAALVCYLAGTLFSFWLSDKIDGALVGLFSFLLMLACLGGYFVISIRRLHDQGRSGTWVLINFIPGIGPLVLLILLGIVEGNKQKNAFGKPFYLRKRTPDRTISEQFEQS